MVCHLSEAKPEQKQHSPVAALRAIVGSRYVHCSDNSTYRYRRGFRYGDGPIEAAVLPGTLVEFWKVAQVCVEAGLILIVQAANTGLTGGSTPDGAYDRPVVIVNTRRLKTIHLLKNGEQVLCLPGSTLNDLEMKLKPLGREPHSVIGSSCIGTSVVGGVSNNSGGALVQRGPAYTEMALFGQVGKDGQLHLVNHLGITLPGDPEEALKWIETGNFRSEEVQFHAGAGHDEHYIKRVRDIDMSTPGRYNADPEQLFEASGNAGRLIIFAVRLDSFPAWKNSQVFYLGTNSTKTLEKARRHLLTAFKEIPIAGEYIHRDAFSLADKYGRDTVAVIRLLGTRFLPALFDMKARIDALGERNKLFPSHLSDRVCQALSRFLPRQVPPRIWKFHLHYEHHMILHTSASLSPEVAQWLGEFFSENEDGSFIQCTKREGDLAFLHRFAAAGAAERYHNIHLKETGGQVTLDIALPRNEWDWFEKLPAELDNKLQEKIYYGHFLCHVLHQDYVVKKNVDTEQVKEEMLAIFDKRNIRYPAEHNVGHVYHAPENLAQHYKSLDPCNCCNPGIGKTSRRKNWQ